MAADETVAAVPADGQADAEESVQVCDGIPLIKEATKHKEQANGHFKRSELHEAVKAYEAALEVLGRSDEFKMMMSERTDVDKLRAVVWCNLSLCRIHQKLFDRAIDAATECLKFDKESSKALHRRSQAHEAMGEWSEALRDSTRLKKLGDGHLTKKESDAEETRREKLWERLQQENRDIDKVAKGQESHWKMKERFDLLVDKYDLGDGQFFLTVARWLTIDEDFDVTVERARKQWKMEKSEAEHAVKWVKLGLEANANDPEVKAIIQVAKQAKQKLQEQQVL